MRSKIYFARLIECYAASLSLSWIELISLSLSHLLWCGRCQFQRCNVSNRFTPWKQCQYLWHSAGRNHWKRKTLSVCTLVDSLPFPLNLVGRSILPNIVRQCARAQQSFAAGTNSLTKNTAFRWLGSQQMYSWPCTVNMKLPTLSEPTQRAFRLSIAVLVACLVGYGLIL